MPKAMTVTELNREFERAHEIDKELFSEQRTNVSLYLGNHYIKKKDFYDRLEKSGVDKGNKIRVTKNHINKGVKFIINSILSQGPGVGAYPQNEGELQDQKAAELHNSIWQDYKHVNKHKRKIRTLCHDFTIIGESYVKLFWDPNKGVQIPGEQMQNPLTGEITQGPPTRSGDVCVERIFPWDLKRPPESKSPEDAEWLAYEKMVSIEKLKASLADNPELIAELTETNDETFQIFDAATGRYSEKKGQVLYREMYWRPSVKYPQGYYAHFTKGSSKPLFEGELPLGFFPILSAGYDEVPTSPRHISPIRQVRSPQAIANRAASSQEKTQLTVGDDKLIFMGGADLQSGSSKAGIRTYKTQALTPPTVLPGRSGIQFVDTMNAAIDEIYALLGVPEQGEEKIDQLDPNTALYKSMRHKMRFSMYAEKFVEYMGEICEGVLKLKKAYMNPAQIVQVVGKSEAANISEFKNSNEIGFQIRVEEMSADAESKLGKQITLTTLMQYGGASLDGEQIALISRHFPYLSNDKILDGMLINHDMADNIMLALDRGEQVQLQPYDDPKYLAPKLVDRTRKADFKYLNPQTQQQYYMMIDNLHQLEAQQVAQLKQAQDELYPLTGASVPLPVYETVAGSNGQPKSQRVQVPQDALQEFVDRIRKQGVAMAGIEDLSNPELAAISQQYFQDQQGNVVDINQATGLPNQGF